MFDHWSDATMLDLREVYGIDVFDGHIHRRPWWWFARHIHGLLDGNTRLARLVQKG